MTARASIRIAFSLAIGLLAADTARGQAPARAAAEAAEALARQLSRSGSRRVVSAAEKACLENGPAVASVVKAAGGPATVARIIEEAGERGPDIIRLIAKRADESIHIISRPGNLAIFLKHGDDAVEALVRHKGLAAELIEMGGKPAADALKGLSPKSGRMLSSMALESKTRELARNPGLLEVLRKHGDEAMKFIWENKGALAVGSALAAFLADPERFMRGGAALAAPLGQAAGEAGKAAGHAAGQAGAAMAAAFPWNTLVVAGSVLAGMSMLPGIVSALLCRRRGAESHEIPGRA